MADFLRPARAQSRNGFSTRRVIIAAVLLASVFLAFAVRTAPGVPPSPHAFMDQQNLCFSCHASYGGQVDPHEFVIEIAGGCLSCHNPAKLGRSHPIGVDPRRSAMTTFRPDSLPLENDKVSCGSCHQPHAAYLSPTMCYQEQEPEFTLTVSPDEETLYYKTYFLRLANPTGFDVLCQACHRDF